MVYLNTISASNMINCLIRNLSQTSFNSILNWESNNIYFNINSSRRNVAYSWENVWFWSYGYEQFSFFFRFGLGDIRLIVPIIILQIPHKQPPLPMPEYESITLPLCFGCSIECVLLNELVIGPTTPQTCQPCHMKWCIHKALAKTATNKCTTPSTIGVCAKIYSTREPPAQTTRNKSLH